MDISSVTSAAISSYQATSAAVKSTKSTESSSTGFSETAAVYEKSSSDGTVTSKTQDYSAIVAQMKSDAESRKNTMMNMVQEMMGQQGVAIGNADDVWSFLASGNYTVTEAAKQQAQEAVSEDGYWGVEKTSDRIVEFAKALSGNDVSKAQELLEAFEKGYSEATKSWGQELPEISQKTYDAVHEKFNSWMNGDETEE